MPKTQTQNTESSLALYDDFDLEALAEDKEEAKVSSDSKWLPALKEGKTILRMLPARKGSSHSPKPWRAGWKHRVEVPGLDKPVTFMCPRAEAHMPCRVCTVTRKLAASSNPVDQKRAEDMKAKRRLFANVFNRGAVEDGVKIWEFGKQVLEQLQDIRDDEEGSGLNFTSIGNGFDIIVIRKGQQLKTEYKLQVDPKCMPSGTPLHPDAKIMKELLDGSHNLDAVAAPPTDAEIADMLAGRKPDRRAAQGPTAADAVYDGQVVDPEDDEE